MENLQTTLVLLIIVGFVAILIAGATNRVVIYFNTMDFIVSLAPWLTLLVTYFLFDIYAKESVTEPSGIQNIIKYSGFIVAAIFIVASMRISVFYNKSVGIGIIVGLFKLISALLGTVVVAAQISKLFDNKTSLKGAIFAMMVISVFLWIGKKLINGEQVYIEKGWALPANPFVRA